MPTVVKRLAETIGVHFALSACFAAVFAFGLLPQTLTTISLSMLGFLCIYWQFQIKCLKEYRLSTCSIKKYFLVNFTMMSILVIIGLCLAIFDVEPLYTWLFFPFKLFTIIFDAAKWLSAAIIGAVYLGITALIPVFD